MRIFSLNLVYWSVKICYNWSTSHRCWRFPAEYLISEAWYIFVYLFYDLNQYISLPINLSSYIRIYHMYAILIIISRLMYVSRLLANKSLQIRWVMIYSYIDFFFLIGERKKKFFCFLWESIGRKNSLMFSKLLWIDLGRLFKFFF